MNDLVAGPDRHAPPVSPAPDPGRPPMVDRLLETGCLPDFVLRFAIRRLLRSRLRAETRFGAEERQSRLNRFLDDLDKAPVAVETDAANEQHYELPAAFFARVLGPRLKYSACLWEPGVASLGEAEEAMLRLTCRRADLSDGMRILELGCGWGSLTLWMAEQYPSSEIVAVSNSASQRDFIERRAAALGLDNLRVLTRDMRDFDTGERFHRVLSVEMFEHMKNHRRLFARIAEWLLPEGRFFLHIFTHRHTPYHFVARDAGDWMSRHFFTGGMMPSDPLPLYFQDRLTLERHWIVNGTHYRRTAEAWLENMRRNRATILPLFRSTYGAVAARKWWAYWEIFFLACAELWGFRGGEEWFVSHYRFRAPD